MPKAEITINYVIAQTKSKSRGRTRYDGQAPYWDEMMVAEIERLRETLLVIRLVCAGALHETPTKPDEYYREIIEGARHAAAEALSQHPESE